MTSRVYWLLPGYHGFDQAIKEYTFKRRGIEIYTYNFDNREDDIKFSNDIEQMERNSHVDGENMFHINIVNIRLLLITTT